MSQYRNHNPQIEEAEIVNENVEKTVQARPNEYLSKKYYVKEINNVKEQIQLEKMPTQVQKLPAEELEPVERVESKMVTKTRPSRVYYE